MIRTKLYHKGRVLTAAVILLLAVGMTGCGKDTGVSEQPEKITTEADKAGGNEEKKLPEVQKDKDTVEKGPEADQKGQDEKVEEDPKAEQKTQDEPSEEKTEKEEEVELNGTVRSVGADSFVISKINVEHHEDYDIAVSVADGASGEELITVYVTDNAVYQYLTVKNSGINPEDITSREGSYGDLQEGLTVILKGRWDKDSFYADELEIEKFT